MECVECVECVVVVVLVVHSPADFLRTLTFVVRTAGAVVRMRLLYFTPADFARTRDDTRFWPGHHGAPCDEGVGAQLARTGLGRARLFVDDVHRTVLPLVRHHHGREFLLTLFTHLSVRPAPLRGDQRRRQGKRSGTKRSWFATTRRSDHKRRCGTVSPSSANTTKYHQPMLIISLGLPQPRQPQAADTPAAQRTCAPTTAVSAKRMHD